MACLSWLGCPLLAYFVVFFFNLINDYRLQNFEFKAADSGLLDLIKELYTLTA